MIQLTILQGELLTNGFKKLSPFNANNIIIEVAKSKGMSPSDVTSQDIFEYHKELKHLVFKETCEDNILEGFTASNGHFYRTNRDDQINLMGQKDELFANEAVATVYWKTEDVGYIPHTREEWMNVYREAFNHKKQILFKYDTKKTLIVNATTEEELIAIKWDDVVAPEEPTVEKIPEENM